MIMPAVILAIQDESDRTYMEWIFQTYHRLMYHYIMEVLHDSWQADDVMQESVVKLIHKIDVLRRLSESKRRNYIITTAKNTAISYLRRESIRKGIAYDDWAKDCIGTQSEEDPEALVLRQEEMEALQLIWDDLDERSRYLLSSRYILEQSFEEMARELGVTAGSARMLLTRAKRAALALIENHVRPLKTGGKGAIINTRYGRT